MGEEINPRGDVEDDSCPDEVQRENAIQNGFHMFLRLECDCSQSHSINRRFKSNPSRRQTAPARRRVCQNKTVSSDWKTFLRIRSISAPTARPIACHPEAGEARRRTSPTQIASPSHGHA